MDNLAERKTITLLIFQAYTQKYLYIIKIYHKENNLKLGKNPFYS